MKILSVEGLSVKYKLRGGIFKAPEYYTVFENLTFNVYKGETLGIKGRNGAGKSTLLRVLAGVLQPNEGRVVNNGVSVSLLALSAGFDPELTGRDNAILNGMLLGYSKQQAIKQLDSIKLFSGLEVFFEKPIKLYSSGMRSRLAFSVAMYLSPDILVLDEVLSVGDKAFKKKAEAAMVEKINSDQTVILVSHSDSQMKRLCSRIIEL